MASTKVTYANSASVTITLNNLAASTVGVGRQSTAVDNSSNLYLDALITVTLVIGAGTPDNDFGATILGFASEDGTNYSVPATGSDGAIDISTINNGVWIGYIPMETASTTYKAVFPIASAFGGILPRKWVIAVINNCNINLAASGNSITYSGVYATTA